jgi:lipopolysaccharide cholinephosphotransferase
MVKNIKELQNLDLKIVINFKEICDKYDLKYYIIGGTLLGAIRHKGFIPWDDDIDLAMPRVDYEKFLELAEEELNPSYKINNFKTNPKYQYYITRIIDENNPIIEKRIGNDTKNAFVSIDIFPIDGAPNSRLLRKIYYTKVMYHRALMSLCYRDSIDKERKRSRGEKMILSILEKIPFEKLLNPNKQKKIIDSILKKQKISNSNNIGTIMGAYRTREIVPKFYFGEGKNYQFQDIYLNGPEFYDEYLTHMYGDYMVLPPKKERKTHFEFKE